MLAIIGGSGFASLAGLQAGQRLVVQTPYGDPSGPLTLGKLRGRDVVFLARHGEEQGIAPHQVNYRANLWALHSREATDVVSVASAGGIRAGLGPGALAIPDQIIDYTHGREATFSGPDRPVTHIDFTRPYCEALRLRLIRAAQAAGEAVASAATYAVTQGPRLETAAEINRLERDGADIVGMTGMPEAALARELGLCYAAIVVVANHAAGRGSSAHALDPAEIRAAAQRASGRVSAILGELVMLDGR